MYKASIGKILILGICLLVYGNAQAQVDAFVQVQMSPSKVVVKQPIKVKVTVYASTWFAQPLDFQNVQVQNAFILPFSRTISGIHYINDKQYSGLEFFFLVFPYESGEYVFPELQIKTSIPPEGGWQGQEVTLKSKPRKFIVEELPKGDNTPEMVAKNVYISERWSKDLSQLKVGDVVTRTIYVRAKGTLPSFITALQIDNPEFASIYPKQPTLKDERDEKDANGMRIEHHTYLFEKEGDFEIPPVTISWWNPYVKRKYQKRLSASKITIAENPNLGMVMTLKDSLDQMAGVGNDTESEQNSWRDYMPQILSGLIYAGAGLILIWLLWMLVIYIIKRRQVYLQSEARYFHQFKRNKDLLSLYQWYDKFRSGKKMSPDIRSEIVNIDVGDPDWNKIVKETSNKRSSKIEQESTPRFRLNP